MSKAIGLCIVGTYKPLTSQSRLRNVLAKHNFHNSCSGLAKFIVVPDGHDKLVNSMSAQKAKNAEVLELSDFLTKVFPKGLPDDLAPLHRDNQIGTGKEQNATKGTVLVQNFREYRDMLLRRNLVSSKMRILVNDSSMIDKLSEYNVSKNFKNPDIVLVTHVASEINEVLWKSIQKTKPIVLTFKQFNSFEAMMSEDTGDNPDQGDEDEDIEDATEVIDKNQHSTSGPGSMLEQLEDPLSGSEFENDDIPSSQSPRLGSDVTKLKNITSNHKHNEVETPREVINLRGFSAFSSKYWRDGKTSYHCIADLQDDKSKIAFVIVSDDIVVDDVSASQYFINKFKFLAHQRITVWQQNNTLTSPEVLELELHNLTLQTQNAWNAKHPTKSSLANISIFCVSILSTHEPIAALATMGTHALLILAKETGKNNNSDDDKESLTYIIPPNWYTQEDVARLSKDKSVIFEEGVLMDDSIIIARRLPDGTHINSIGGFGSKKVISTQEITTTQLEHPQQVYICNEAFYLGCEKQPTLKHAPFDNTAIDCQKVVEKLGYPTQNMAVPFLLELQF